MRYSKEFHHWPQVHLIALALGFACLGLVALAPGLEGRFTALTCAGVAVVAAWVLWCGRSHYLDIGPSSIVHQGFRRWQVRTPDLLPIEQRCKACSDDRDPYLLVHARPASIR